MADDERPRKLAKVDHVDVGSIENGTEKDQLGNKPNPSLGAILDQDVPQATSEIINNGTKISSNVACGEQNILAPDEVAAPIVATEIEATENVMSKNAMKRLRKKKEWEAKRDERKVIRKAKAVAKKERNKAAKEQEAASNPQNGVDNSSLPKPPRPRSVRTPVTLLIDCDFDDLMRDNERISLASQITRAYSCNKNSLFRADLSICAFGGHLKDRFEKVLIHHKQWQGVQWLTEDFVTAADIARNRMIEDVSNYRFGGAFAKFNDADEDELQKLKDEAEIVYLSAESNEIITELKPFSTYIIGGLVDKNREKGLCHRRAVQRSVKTGRLPIGEFLELQSRKVLATNHVCEIMCAWMECGDWGEAFMKIIPKRKGGKLKHVGDDVDSKQDDEHDHTTTSDA